MRLVTLLSLLLVLVAIPAARPLSDPHTHAQAHLLRSQHRVTMGQASRLGLRGGSCADGLNAPEHARAEKMEGTARLSAQMTALWSHTEQLRRFASSPATLPPAGPAAGAAAGIGGSTIQDPGSDAGGGGGVGGADGAAKEQRIESEEQAEQAVRALEEQLSHPSALFRHELCYALGQTGRASAGATLRAVLSNREEHEMVRHEAAEALAALAHPACQDTLREFLSDPSRAVSETCEVALARLGETAERPGVDGSASEALPREIGHFGSVDPAPAMGGARSLAELGAAIFEPALSLFQQYTALFAIRDRGGEEEDTREAVSLLAHALTTHPSALFRHEAAFVLGQLAHADALPHLASVLADTDQHAMVRHEAAEAIGGIGEPSSEPLLRSFLQDPDPVVRESCEVALDMSFYWAKWGARNPDASSPPLHSV